MRSEPELDRRAFLGATGAVLGGLGVVDAADAVLPPGVRAEWDLKFAHRETKPTRERVCLNGLWRWQPARDNATAVPADGWGYFKVPGFWPGNVNYSQDDCQTLFPHPDWKSPDIRSLTAAWYEREMRIPEDWKGRRIGISAAYLHSFAVVYLDGAKVGELRYPGGDLDISAHCRSGATHKLSLLVTAMPLKGVLLSYTDTNSAREVKGTVARRGLCGDVWLTSTPDARIADVKFDTSVRKSELTVAVALENLDPNRTYALAFAVRDGARMVHQFTSKPFTGDALVSGRIATTESWKPDRLWDIHTPRHVYELDVSLRIDTAAIDTWYPARFGFREFWIEGRDFYLNGTRLQLSAVPLDNAQISVRTASYAACRETFARLRRFGINFVYTHNYGCEPGSHLSFEEVLRAADDAGMLVAFSQPHFAHYDWKAADADRANGYARHAAFYVRAAQNHPSVVAYSMSHNATGYDEDMNPDLLGGAKDPRAGETWSQNNARLARRAEAIVKKLDPGRIVYHHASGNLGSMHTANFYVNFVPIQEMSDWFEHWAADGVKPLFLCEYGVPFTWDWTMYRGWYKGKRTFGSAEVPWEFCLAEWNAQFLGDRAYRLGDAEQRNLRWEASQFRAGKLWHRWDYPVPVGSSQLEGMPEVLARYLTDNWRAARTWGLSANSPWEYAAFWKPRPGVDRRRIDLTVDWGCLQKPGFSPDYVQPRTSSISVDLDASDWVATPAAEALLRNNQPLLAYIAGKPASFTGKDHNYHAGETVEKQLIVINNSREPATCDCTWSVHDVTVAKTITVKAGEQARIPIDWAGGGPSLAREINLSAAVKFSDGTTQTDVFPLHIIPRTQRPPFPAVKVALFDPIGETETKLERRDIAFQRIDAAADLSAFDLLVIGKKALTVAGPGPNLGRVRDGLKVVVFEQTAQVLEQRLGFRSTEYGLREVFPRVPGHPILTGLDAKHLRDWRGEATLVPPRLTYTLKPMHGPTVAWCGLDVSRAWRCGCRGNVASVSIEKPARGDFLPIADGGFGLQYSPLLEYRDGKGVVLFCQLDVSGRSENDPAAEMLVDRVLRYAAGWKPSRPRTVMYAGEPAGKKHLEAVGLAPADYTRQALAEQLGGRARDRLLVVGPGGGKVLSADARALDAWIRDRGGAILAVGLDQSEARAFLPDPIETQAVEHIASYFDAPHYGSPFAGIGPADLMNRDPRALPLVTAGAELLGNGVLARRADANVVFCQAAAWQFDLARSMNLKRTFRRLAFTLSRLIANAGVRATTPLLDRFGSPPAAGEHRWREGLYLDTPEEWDDPYRFFRW